MKQNTFIAILSMVVVTLGMVITIVETGFLVRHGATPESAFIDSLYTGFLGWIILAAVLFTTDRFYDHVTNKIIKK